MGLRDLLTKEIRLTSALINWREPALFRVRLRNDLTIRLLIVLAAWLASTGLLLILYAFSTNPTGIFGAFGLGLLGAAVGYVILLGRRGHVSGSCWLYRDKITWQSMSTGFFTLQGNIAELEFDEIDRCIIVPAKHLGKPFSVMLIDAYGDRTLLGIPQHIDLIQVAKIFTAMKVNVTTAQQVPTEYTRGIPLALGATAPVIASVVFITGLIMIGSSPHDDRHRELARPEIPGMVQPSQVVVIERPETGAIGSTASVDGTEPARDLQPSAPAINAPIPDGLGFRPPTPFIPAAPTGTASPSVPEIRPGSSRTIADSGSDSQLLGGGGGIPFRVVSPHGEPVLAVQYALGQWSGKERVSRLLPVFERPKEQAGGMLIVAREGYALGAIQVDAGTLVDAVQLVFMRLRDDGSLDEQDSYTSDWIGTPNEENVRTLSGNGTPVVGFHGRGAAVLDAIGLVFGSDSG